MDFNVMSAAQGIKRMTERDQRQTDIDRVLYRQRCADENRGRSRETKRGDGAEKCSRRMWNGSLP